ncbi:hypothetical protein HF888_00705 [Bermanella marisrubri]|uniref:Uncharacterized protein n=1 Tax=Bermanella marisrubri TaxID=207949 RepID=Q1N430_9GAMM|nr:PA4642 family protein [Bermanella marisrubri]EAT13035.1 hypothetical protein RED65_15102 [Oceanobacter sp. RED65] [Bermanella marisrubri]QIZ82843.1 hypothetical protein HF888_00705 [Bermanella marisrubri]
MLKKDKQKVFGGEWTEEHMRFFLDSKSYDGTDVDFINLIRAYQHMTEETFAEFVDFFKEEGHNLNATNLNGETALSIISEHANSEAYANALKEAGAE